MANEDLVERLLRQSILSLGRETLTFNKKLSTEALIVLTIDENTSTRIVINISDVRYKQRMSEDEDEEPVSSVNQDLLKRLLEKSTQPMTKETLIFQRCLKVEGLVTYEVDDRKHYVVKIGYKVRPNNESGNERPVTGVQRMKEKEMEKAKEPRPKNEHKQRNAHVDTGKLQMSTGITESINEQMVHSTKAIDLNAGDNISKTKETIVIYERNSSNEPDGIVVHSTKGVNVGTAAGLVRQSTNGMDSSTTAHVLKKAGLVLQSTKGTDSSTTANLVPHVGLADEMNADAMKAANQEDTNANYFEKEYYIQKGLKLNEASNLPCGKCNTICENISLLVSHTSTAHQSSTCLVCTKAFSNKHGLKRHILRHLSPDFECQLCQKQFFERCALRKHLFTHANAKGKQKAPGKDTLKKLKGSTKSVNNTSDQRPVTVSTTMNVDCIGRECCNTRFVEHRSYLLHMLSHKGNKSINFRCLFCEWTGPTFDSLSLHLRAHMKSVLPENGSNKGLNHNDIKMVSKSTKRKMSGKTENVVKSKRIATETVTNKHKASQPTSQTAVLSRNIVQKANVLSGQTVQQPSVRRNDQQPNVVNLPGPSRFIHGVGVGLVERIPVGDSHADRTEEDETATCGACACKFMSSKYLEVHLKNNPDHKL